MGWSMANSSQTLCLSTDTTDGTPCQNLVAHFTYKCAAGHVPATRHFPTETTETPAALASSMAQGTVDFDDLGYGEPAESFGDRVALSTENWPYNPTAYVLRTDERLAAYDHTRAIYRAMKLEGLEPELEKVQGEISRIFDFVESTQPEMITHLPSSRLMSDDVPQEIRALKEEMLARRSILKDEIKEKRYLSAAEKRRAEFIAENKANQAARDAEIRALIQPQTTEELEAILKRTKSAEVSYQYRDSTESWETNQLRNLREQSRFAKEELERRGMLAS